MVVGCVIQNIVFGTVLLSIGLLFRWIPEKTVQAGTCRRTDDYVSDLDYAAIWAMTGLEGESAVMLFGTIMQLLKLCGAIRNFDHPFKFALRRIKHSLF